MEGIIRYRKFTLFSIVFIVSFFAFLYTKIIKSEITFEQLKNGTKISREKLDKTITKFLATYPEKEQIDSYPIFKKIISKHSKAIIHADLHGDSNALFSFINQLIIDGYIDDFENFRIKNQNVYLVFTGDFSDRGPNGLEVWYTIMRLRIENPNQVIILRGNHEDISSNKISKVNFFNELKNKQIIDGKKIDEETKENISINDEFEELVFPIYNVLPTAALLGVKNSKNFINYTMFVHAGIEPRIDLRKLLESDNPEETVFIDELDISWIDNENLIKEIKDLTKTKNIPDGLESKVSSDELSQRTEYLGFLWSDFILDDTQIASISDRIDKEKSKNMIANYGKETVIRYLNSLSKDVKNYYEDTIQKNILNKFTNNIFKLIKNKNIKNTDTISSTSNIKGYQVWSIIRGHQHSGDLLLKMLKYNGIYGLWDVEQRQSDHYVKKEPDIKSPDTTKINTKNKKSKNIKTEKYYDKNFNYEGDDSDSDNSIDDNYSDASDSDSDYENNEVALGYNNNNIEDLEFEENFIAIPKYSVWTLLASPATFNSYKKFKNKVEFDTYAIMRFSEDPIDWSLEPINIKIETFKDSYKDNNNNINNINTNKFDLNNNMNTNNNYLDNKNKLK